MRGSSGGLRAYRDKGQRAAETSGGRIAEQSSSILGQSKMPPRAPGPAGAPGLAMNALLDLPNAASLLSHLVPPGAAATRTEEPPASALDEYDDEDSEGGGAATSSTDYSSSGRFNAGGALGSSGSKQVLVAGSQFRIINKQAGCESCLAYDAKAKRQKEAIRSLKVQISRLQEQVLSLRKGRGDPLATPGDDGGSIERLAQTLRRCEELEMENRRLSNLSAADQSLVASLREGSMKLTLEVSTLQASLAVAREECGARSSSLRDVQGLLDAARMELLQHQAALDHSEGRLRLLHAREQHGASRAAADAAEISRLRAALLDAEAAAREAGVKLDTASLEVLSLTSGLGRAMAKAAEADAARASAEQQREESESRAAETEEARRILDGLLRQECDRSEGLDLLMGSQSNACRVAEEETARLAAALDEAVSQAVADRGALAAQQAALLKALQSSVRLLIVAPSVNVTVGDTRLRLKGQLSEGSLRRVLSSEVMGKFSQVLPLPEPGPEAEEGAGAVGGEEWIQRLLLDMQRTIESHVQKAMESPTSP